MSWFCYSLVGLIPSNPEFWNFGCILSYKNVVKNKKEGQESYHERKKGTFFQGLTCKIIYSIINKKYAKLSLSLIKKNENVPRSNSSELTTFWKYKIHVKHKKITLWDNCIKMFTTIQARSYPINRQTDFYMHFLWIIEFPLRFNELAWFE